MMDRNAIISCIDDLARSQGLYCKLKRDLEELKEDNPAEFERLMEEWESKGFKDRVDFILFIET